MVDFTLLIIFTGIFAFLNIRFMSVVSYKIGLVDSPDTRKDHAGFVPLVGGISIFTTYLITVTIFAPSDITLSAILISAVVIFVINLWDDLRTISWRYRLIAQIVATVLVIQFLDLKIDHLGGVLWFDDIETGSWAYFLTVFAVIGVTNAFNFIDGIDGLCAGMALCALAGISLSLNLDGILFINILILATCLVVFITFNLWSIPKKVFLGDSGSGTLGFVIAWLAIFTSQSESTGFSPTFSLWFLAIPVFDTVRVILMRALKGNSIFEPDHLHIHHVLVNVGMSKGKALIFLVCLSIFFLLIGIYIDTVIPNWNVPAFICLFFIQAVIILKLDKAIG